MKKSPAIARALLIGFVCIFTYLASYYLRHVLSAFTPLMLEEPGEVFTKVNIGLFSSVYMIVYAAGQLVNGVLGDILKPRYMVFTGLTLAAAAMFVFPVTEVYLLRLCCFGLLGFGLSMLRGPLVKVISENMKPDYARIACVFLSFVAFLGPFVAGLFVAAMAWRTAFYVSAAIAIGMAVFSFVSLFLMEKFGTVQPVERRRRAKGEKLPRRKIDVLGVFRIPRFVGFVFIGMITEISATSIAFWIPTYINEYLAFPAETAALLATVISFIKAFAPFVCLFLFRLFRKNDTLMIRVMFAISMVLYVVMLVMPHEGGAVWANMVVFLFAMFATSIASATLWSMYIPSLGKTGKVSSANGVMDSTGYVAAALMNMAFTAVMQAFDWRGVIITWAITMAVGVAITLFIRNKKPEDEDEHFAEDDGDGAEEPGDKAETPAANARPGDGAVK